MVRVSGPHQAVTSCQDQHAAAQAGDACHEQRLSSSLLVVSSRSNKSTGSHPLQQQVSSGIYKYTLELSREKLAHTNARSCFRAGMHCT